MLWALVQDYRLKTVDKEKPSFWNGICVMCFCFIHIDTLNYKQKAQINIKHIRLVRRIHSSAHQVIYKHYKCKSKQDKWVDMRSVTSSLSGNIHFGMFWQSFWRSYWTNWPLQDNSIWLMIKYCLNEWQFAEKTRTVGDQCCGLDAYL